MQPTKKPKMGALFADKGFYIILILCIAAIGISGYVLFFSGEGSDSELSGNTLSALDAPSNRESDLPGTEEITLQTAIPEDALRETEVILPTPLEDSMDNAESVLNPVPNVPVSSKSPNSSEKPKATPKPVSASFYVWPVNGEILEEFSVDELVFNDTLGDWRVHPGTDISASLGAEVCAMGDGIVEDVYTDERMGVTVVIDHGNRIRSVYSNLMESVTVSIGDVLYAGDVIGGVGQTAESELLQAPHLHLEVIQNGAQIDPCELLP